MRELSCEEKEQIIGRVSDEYAADRWHRRSWRAYLRTMDFFEGTDGRVYALRQPQIVKTVYVPSDSHAPKDEDEARAAWVEANLSQARRLLPAQEHMATVPYLDKNGGELFCEVRNSPRHTEELTVEPDKADLPEIIEAAARVYRLFSKKLSRAWSCYGSLVIAQPR